MMLRRLLKNAGNRLLTSLSENSGNPAHHGQGLLPRVRKPAEMPGVLTEYRPLRALPQGRGSQEVFACSGARFRARSFHTDSYARGCSENTRKWSRLATAFSSFWVCTSMFILRSVLESQGGRGSEGHPRAHARGCSEIQGWRTRGRTALSTRHRAVCRFVSYIMAWDREVRPLDETVVTPDGLRHPLSSLLVVRSGAHAEIYAGSFHGSEAPVFACYEW